MPSYTPIAQSFTSLGTKLKLIPTWSVQPTHPFRFPDALCCVRFSRFTLYNYLFEKNSLVSLTTRKLQAGTTRGAGSYVSRKAGYESDSTMEHSTTCIRLRKYQSPRSLCIYQCNKCKWKLDRHSDHCQMKACPPKNSVIAATRANGYFNRKQAVQIYTGNGDLIVKEQYFLWTDATIFLAGCIDSLPLPTKFWQNSDKTESRKFWRILRNAPGAIVLERQIMWMFLPEVYP